MSCPHICTKGSNKGKACGKATIKDEKFCKDHLRVMFMKEEATAVIAQQVFYISINETFDGLKLRNLLHNDAYWVSDNAVEQEDLYCLKAMLTKYLSTCKIIDYNKGICSNEVHYYQTNFGRLMNRITNPASKYGYTKWSAANMKSTIRNLCFHQFYFDVDMKAAHNTITYYYFKHKQLPLTKCSYWYKQRDQLLEQMVESYSIDRKTAKKLFLSMLYGGSTAWWFESNGIEDPEFQMECLSSEKEVHDNIITCCHNELSSYYQHALNIGVQKEDIETKDAYCRAWAIFCQTVERKLLQYSIGFIENFLKEQKHYINYQVGALIHDGFHLPKDILLSDVEEAINLLTSNLKTESKSLVGFRCPMKWTIKKMDVDVSLDLMSVSNIWDTLSQSEKLDWIKEGKNNIQESDLPITSHPTYLLMKKSFEQQVCYIESRNEYHYVSYNWEEDDWISYKFYSLSKLKERFLDWSFNIRDKEGKVNSYQFINIWVKDSTKRKYHHANCYPPGFTFSEDHTLEMWEKNNLNLWRGFLAEKYQPLGELEKEKQTLNVNVILTHIKYLMGNEENFKYYMALESSLAVRPGYLPGIIPTLYSADGGIGKTSLYKLKEAWMGSHLVWITSNIEQVCGKFNSSIEGKVFIALDEVKILQTEQGEQYYNTLLTLTCGGQIPLERKGKDVVTYKSFTHFEQYTNNFDAKKVNDNTRRDWFIDCANGRLDNKPDKEYFDHFYEILSNNRAMRAWYEYLVNYYNENNIEQYNFQTNKPNTTMINDLKEFNTPIEHTFFLQYIINKLEEVSKPTVVSTYETPFINIYKDFVSWCKDLELSTEKRTLHKFLSVIKARKLFEKIYGELSFSKRKTKLGAVYTFDLKCILSHLLSSDVIDDKEKDNLTRLGMDLGWITSILRS